MKTTILASLVALALGPLAEARCVGDIAVDGRVDGGDLGVLLANWGPVTSTALSHACDLDGNGQVNGADLGLVLSNWGTCPTVLTEVVPNIGVVQGGHDSSNLRPVSDWSADCSLWKQRRTILRRFQ